MDLTEQIARALCEVDWGVWRPELVDHYTKRAQAVLPFIAAERERCVAEIARVGAEASRCADEAYASPEYRKTGATMSMFAAMCDSMIALIRRQP